MGKKKKHPCPKIFRKIVGFPTSDTKDSRRSYPGYDMMCTCVGCHLMNSFFSLGIFLQFQIIIIFSIPNVQFQIRINTEKRIGLYIICITTLLGVTHDFGSVSLSDSDRVNVRISYKPVT